MISKTAVEDILSIISSVLIFLGLQNVIGEWITKYPWLFVSAGAILFYFRRKITESVGV